jgi:hypothetical protein
LCRDLIVFSFLFTDLIVFLVSVQGPMYKIFDSQLR